MNFLSGIFLTALAAAGLKRLGVVPRRIVSSGLLRALQTAEILNEVLGGGPAVETSEALTPWADPPAALALLAEAGRQDIAFVGHLPHLPMLAALLLTGGIDGIELTMKKAAVCCLDLPRLPFDPGDACLEWLAQPKQLRALGEVE